MKKRQTFQYRKDFGHFFRLLEPDKCQVSFYKGPEDVFDSYCGSNKISSFRHKRLLKTQIFEKKGNLSSETKI